MTRLRNRKWPWLLLALLLASGCSSSVAPTHRSVALGFRVISID